MSQAYEALSKIRKEFRIDWYRCPIDPRELKKLTRRSNGRGFVQSIGFLLLIVATAVLTYTLFVEKLWLGFALALFVHGTIYSFSSHAGHELSHGTVFPSKWLNALFLRIYSTLSWFNFHHYKMSHTYHHLYTLHPRGDREVVLPQTPSLKLLYLLQLFTVSITGGLESPGIIRLVGKTIRLAVLGTFSDEWSNALFTPDQKAARRKAIRWARFLVLFHLTVVVLSIVFRLWMLPVLLTFGGFIANWWRYFVGLPMHNGLRDNVPDFRLCVRTIKLDPFSTFIYWRMNYHTEHHMYAAVPCYNLRRLQNKIARDMPKPRSLGEAWREMRSTWRKQQEDPTYQFETALPRRDCPESDQDPGGASLGDLAPNTLDP